MHVLNFIVKKQIIAYTPCRPLIADSVGHVYARFTLDDEWAGLAATVIFENTRAEKPVSVMLTAEPVEVPAEVLVDGHLSVSLVGLGEGGATRLPTAQMSVPIKVYRAGQLIGVDPQRQPPEIWEQLIAAIGPMSELDTTAKSSLVHAINEIFSKGSTSGGNDIYFGPGEMPDGYREQIVPQEDRVINYNPLSETERERIIQEILEELKIPVMGTVVEDKVVRLTASGLPAGTYTFVIEFEDGSVATIGTVTKEA